jgi:hypothetical protein
MTANLTDSDVFTDPIVVPVDGEPDDQVAFALAPQGLANRTRNNKNRIDALQEYVVCSLAVSGLTSGQEATITIDAQSGGASVSGGTRLELPSAGVWEFHVTLPRIIVSGSTICDAYAIKGTGTARLMGCEVPASGDTGNLSTSFIETITTPATSGDRVGVVMNSVAGTMTLGYVNTGVLIARRIA